MLLSSVLVHKLCGSVFLRVRVLLCFVWNWLGNVAERGTLLLDRSSLLVRYDFILSGFVILCFSNLSFMHVPQVGQVAKYGLGAKLKNILRTIVYTHTSRMWGVLTCWTKISTAAVAIPWECCMYSSRHVVQKNITCWPQRHTKAAKQGYWEYL